MTSSLFNYLLESSLCLVLFIAAYRFLISNLTYFSWIRFYLIASVILSLVLPLIIIPIEWQSKLLSIESMRESILSSAKQIGENSEYNNATRSWSAESSYFGMAILFNCLLTAYILGCIYKAYSLAKNLRNIYRFIKQSSKVKEANYWIIDLNSEMPAFSFFNYIFINYNYKDLSADEIQVIKNHELVHIKQRHTLDILFVELVSIVFWFNPLLSYIRKSIQETHEFIVDEKIGGYGQNKKAYAHLLLNLASGAKVFNLVINFTGDHIKRRITMMAKPRTLPKYRLVFFILIPLTVFLLLSFSYTKYPTSNLANIRSTGRTYLTNTKELEKYRGLYIPQEVHLGIVPMDILFLHNKLYRFLEKHALGQQTIELKYVADHTLTYTDESDRSIEFIVDSEGKVKGCILTRPDGIYGFTKQK